MRPLVAAGESNACRRPRAGRRREAAPVRPLAQEAARAGSEGLYDEVVLLEGGQHEDLDSGQVLVLGDQPGGLDAVQLGHPDVHDHDIGTLGPGQPYRLPPVGGLPDDLHVRLCVDEEPERAPEQSLVVGEQDANGHG